MENTPDTEPTEQIQDILHRLGEYESDIPETSRLGTRILATLRGAPNGFSGSGKDLTHAYLGEVVAREETGGAATGADLMGIWRAMEKQADTRPTEEQLAHKEAAFAGLEAIMPKRPGEYKGANDDDRRFARLWKRLYNDIFDLKQTLGRERRAAKRLADESDPPA